MYTYIIRIIIVIHSAIIYVHIYRLHFVHSFFQNRNTKCFTIMLTHSFPPVANDRVRLAPQHEPSFRFPVSAIHTPRVGACPKASRWSRSRRCSRRTRTTTPPPLTHTTAAHLHTISSSCTETRRAPVSTGATVLGGSTNGNYSVTVAYGGVARCSDLVSIYIKNDHW